MSAGLSFKDFELVTDHIELLLPEDAYEVVAVLGAVFNRRVAALPPEERGPLIAHFRAAFELIMDRLYPRRAYPSDDRRLEGDPPDPADERHDQ